MNKASGLIHSAVQDIFQNNDKILDRQRQDKKSHLSVSKKDMELALTVLLVDLAGCDQNFDAQEYNIIQNGLRRVFGTTKSEVTALINQANVTLKNLRGTGRFAGLLKESLGDNERRVIMEVIEDVIAADGVEDGFETYLRHKFSELLGAPTKETPPTEEMA